MSFGSHTISVLPTSISFISSAPFSMAISYSFSSDASEFINNLPFASNRYATLPAVPKFPPYFVNACLISETVLFLLSVRVFM